MLADFRTWLQLTSSLMLTCPKCAIVYRVPAAQEIWISPAVMSVLVVL